MGDGLFIVETGYTYQDVRVFDLLDTLGCVCSKSRIVRHRFIISSAGVGKIWIPTPFFITGKIGLQPVALFPPFPARVFFDLRGPVE
jgi:hypothetical protein